MNFSENLQNLRNAKNMTQEELAERLDVSRQAVSKWESGTGYPETEKIITICEIFDCSMDTLMKGKISFDETGDRKGYDSIYNRYSKGIAFGVGLIIFALTIVIGLYDIIPEEYEIFLPIIIMTGALIAVPIFIYLSMSFNNYQKENPKMPYIYTGEEIKRFNRKYAVILSACVSIIIFGVIVMIALVGLSAYEEPTFPVAILFGILTIVVPIIIHYSIQKGKYDIDGYNKESGSNSTKEDVIIDKASGVIMLLATFIFLAAGFIWDLWHIAWVVFPLGGILCAIVGTIFEKD